MMALMTHTNPWAGATERYLEKKAQKALRRNRPLKVYSAKETQWYLEHGWQILSHNPVSYGAPQFWLLTPAH